jgi:hypothetical protein
MQRSTAGGHFPRPLSRWARVEVGHIRNILQGIMLTWLGIYAPGYEERRRQRLLAKYGIDVNAAQEAA